jgi:hypothetical protein
MDETDIDGFNLAYAIAHETVQDVVDLIVPELQKRGRYQTAYTEGSLRHQLFQRGARLPEDHVGRKVTIST